MNDAASARFHVVIPTYDRPSLLVETVLSALSQTVPGVRLTVVDNASGAATAEALAPFATDLQILRYEEHLPYQGNLTRAKDLIDAPHGMVLHDDDLLDPDFVETALDAFERHPDVAMVIMDIRPLAAAGVEVPDLASTLRWARMLGLGRTVEGPAGAEMLLPPGVLPDALARVLAMCPYWPAVALRTSAYREAGPYDAELVTLLDVDMWMRVSAAHPVLLVDAVRASYRFHAGSKTAEYGGSLGDPFVRDVLRIHARAAADEPPWSWDEEHSRRWLSNAIHRWTHAPAAQRREQFERLGLDRYGVTVDRLHEDQMDASRLRLRAVRPAVPPPLPRRMWRAVRRWMASR